jgi:serine/threonine-protein kinase
MQSMVCHLKLLGPRPVRLKLAKGELLRIGRAPDNDLCLDDKLVSRRHCQLDCDGGGVIVRDLTSRNGTFLNGQRLDGELRARPGDQIKVGSAYLLVEGGGAQAAPSPEVERTMKVPSLRPMTERPPALPGYEIREELGFGDTGKIYMARSLFDKRDVAIKVMHPRAGEDETKIQRFMREAGVLKRLDHPNIVRVFEVEKAAGLYYYTMELLEGTTLAERLQAGPLSAREALAIGVQVAMALELVHGEDVIHRDISPRNILISPGGVAKLFDFGAVKFETAGGHSLTGLGEIVGELVYSSPEQVRDPRQVDHRTDLYALGATLYHAIAGRPPIEEGNNHLETVRRVLSAQVPPLRRFEPSVPRKVDDVIRRLLSKEPGLRMSSASEVLHELEAALLVACGPERDGGSDSDHGAFGGGYSGVELLEILQFLEFSSKDGVLVVSAPPLEGDLHLLGGCIISATAGELDGEEAISALLSTAAGTFRFRSVVSASQVHDAGIRVKPSAAALEAMRRRDELVRTR